MHSLPKLLLFASVAVFVATGVSYSQQAGDSMSAGTSSHNASSSSSDTKFVRQAAEGGMAEVALGQLAAQKASSDDVKKFGQRMVDDHSKANDQLKQIASEKNIDLPRDLSMKDKATKARLEKLSGSEFDQAYMSDMVKDHRKDISDFRQESTSGEDPDVKRFATQTLPTLKSHLKQAESITPQSSASVR